MADFKVVSEYSPAGDQPQAIQKLASGLEMGFEEETIGLAYERSCLNTGGLAWPYINKILLSWHKQGLHTVQQIRSGDHKPVIPKGASGELGDAELAAIQQLMKEG